MSIELQPDRVPDGRRLLRPLQHRGAAPRPQPRQRRREGVALRPHHTQVGTTLELITSLLWLSEILKPHSLS